MLYDWHHFDLTQVKEELVKLLLIRAVKNQIRSEDKDAGSQDGQNFKRLKANYAIEQEVDLIDFQRAHESKVDPLEGRA